MGRKSGRQYERVRRISRTFRNSKWVIYPNIALDNKLRSMRMSGNYIKTQLNTYRDI